MSEITACLRTRFQRGGFTIIELLMVMFIIALLLAVAVPDLSKFAKTSKVQQAATAVDTAMFQARSQAQNLRVAVGVFFGADMSPQNLQLTPTPLPPPGSIEIWGVLASLGPGFGGYNATSPPGNPPGPWFPYLQTTKLLMRTPINLPDGIKVVSGYFYRYQVSANTWRNVWGFPFYRRTPQGEVKRHETVFSYTGGIAESQTVNTYNFPYLLIYDEATGEHVVMEAGRPQSASRPRMLPYQLTHMVNYSGGNCTPPAVVGTETALTDLRQLPGLIDNYPGND